MHLSKRPVKDCIESNFIPCAFLMAIVLCYLHEKNKHLFPKINKVLTDMEKSRELEEIRRDFAKEMFGEQ